MRQIDIQKHVEPADIGGVYWECRNDPVKIIDNPNLMSKSYWLWQVFVKIRHNNLHRLYRPINDNGSPEDYLIAEFHEDHYQNLVSLTMGNIDWDKIYNETELNRPIGFTEEDVSNEDFSEFNF